MRGFRPAKRRVEVSVGESVRIVRELQELTQSQLAELTGMPQTTISAIENGRVNLGVERAKVLARALKCHPAVLVFPGWEVASESAAQQGVRGATQRPRRSAKNQKKRPRERAQSGGERKFRWADYAVRVRQRFAFARTFAFVLRTARFALRARVDFAAGHAAGPRFTTFA